MFYEFELSLNDKKKTEVFIVKGEVTVGHSAALRWFKKFHKSCKNLNDQARSGCPKSVDFEAML